MLSFPLHNAKKILCLGAHSDDIEIGVGGTLLKLAESQPDLEVRWVVFCAPGKRKEEAEKSAAAFLSQVQKKEVQIEAFRESYFPEEWAVIKDCFEKIRKSFEPDVVFTHFRDDRHQDHRVLSDLTWNTFRNHFVLEYEIPKYDGDLGKPSAYVSIPPPLAEKKVELLMSHFATQSNKHWFTDDLFKGLMRIRGMESATRFAEAFHLRKIAF